MAILQTAPLTDNDIDGLEVVPGKTVGKDFYDFVAKLHRPYHPISQEQFERVRQMAVDANTDVLMLDGRAVTFASADGGYALCPLTVPVHELDDSEPAAGPRP